MTFDKKRPVISDDYMQKMIKTMRHYTVVALRPTAKRAESGADQIVWEHGRRNFMLRSDGRLNIVCPVSGENATITGFCVFSTNVDDTKKIMDEDPAVRAGVFTYEAYPVLSFPGDALAKEE